MSAGLNDKDFIDLIENMKIFDSFSWDTHEINKAIADIQKWFKVESASLGTVNPEKLVELKAIKDYIRRQI